MRPKSSKTPRGVVTSYGTYILTLIDFKPPKPEHECYRVSGVFDYRILSQTSPVHLDREEKLEQQDVVEAAPLMATSRNMGIDITTNDFIFNNISFPCQTQEVRHTPENTQSEDMWRPPKQSKLPISPITYTTTSVSSVSKSKLEESIDNMLSQAKADSYGHDVQSNSEYTE